MELINKIKRILGISENLKRISQNRERLAQNKQKTIQNKKRVDELEKDNENLRNSLALLSQRIKELKSLHHVNIKKINLDEQRVLRFLKKPMTTAEVSKKLKKSRPWTSLLLNKLERENKVKESGKKGRALLYRKI